MKHRVTCLEIKILVICCVNYLLWIQFAIINVMPSSSNKTRDVCITASMTLRLLWYYNDTSITDYIYMYICLTCIKDNNCKDRNVDVNVTNNRIDLIYSEITHTCLSGSICLMSPPSTFLGFSWFHSKVSTCSLSYKVNQMIKTKDYLSVHLVVIVHYVHRRTSRIIHAAQSGGTIS